MWHTKRQRANGNTWVVHRREDGFINIYNGARIKEFLTDPNKVAPDKVFNSSLVQERKNMFQFMLSL